jgi:hypothetical protein
MRRECAKPAEQIESLTEDRQKTWSGLTWVTRIRQKQWHFVDADPRGCLYSAASRLSFEMSTCGEGTESQWKELNATHNTTYFVRYSVSRP